MPLSNIPWLRTLLAYVLLITAFLLYGHLNFYRDPGSMFFDESRAFERQYSLHRQLEIEEFTNNTLTTGQHDFVRADDQPALCVSFLSVKREGNQYLPLAAASCVQGLSSCERKDLFVNVLLAHTNTSEHPSSELSWLADLMDSVHGYEVSSEQRSILQKLEEQRDFSSKAVFDYTYALDDCYNTLAPWVAILEDDIILADGWLVKTLQGLYRIQDRLATSSSDWLFLRLFNQERSTGWASRIPGQNHEILIAMPITILTFVGLKLVRSRFSFFRKSLDNVSVAIICILAIPTFVFLFFQAGKASMLPPGSGVRNEAFGCCSQALVFPRVQIPRIKKYLSLRKSGQIDVMLDDLAVRDSLDRYALYPVQLQHIGQRSARGTMAREAQAIWSMTFEDQDPAYLRRSHAELVDLIYGMGCQTR